MTDRGEDVEINRRAAESDLLVYVNVNLVAMDGGHKSVPIGLASYKSLRHHHNPKTMVAVALVHGPHQVAPAPLGLADGALLKDHLDIFQIETTLNNDVFGAPYDFLLKREWEWSVRDQASMLAVRRGLGAAPRRLRHKLFHDLRSPYGLTGINAGDTEAVHERTIELVHRQQLVEVQGQTDVLVMGVPYLGPYNVNSSMNPILATCMGLGYFFNSYRGQPVVRRGGAVILYHPLNEGFNQLHHPSYVDFYEEILAESTDPAVIAAKYEEQFADRPLVHPPLPHLARLPRRPPLLHVVLGGARDGPRRRGHLGRRRPQGRVAARASARRSTLSDALEMASGAVGSNPSISYMHNPPHLIADVK